MPRRPLAEISANSNKRGGIEGRFELTSNWRSHIVGRACGGQSPKAIAEDLQIPLSTIYSTVSRNETCFDNESLHRSGRSNIVSDSLRRRLLREVRVNPKIQYRELRLNLGLHGKAVSKSSLYHILKDEGIINWLAKKRPQLTPEVAAKRLQFAKDHEHWGPNEWKVFLWSDECSVERGSGKKRQWVFRTPAQKWDKEMIQPYNKGKDKSVMVWACFGGDGRKSDLVFMPGDPDAKRGGVTSAVYLEVLEEQMPTLWEPGLIYMQDGASIHTARIIKRWLADNGIEVVDWPPYSPDLNPIEHVWRHLKEWVHEHYPELETLTGSDQLIKERMVEALQEAWAALNDEFLENLVESMERQIKTVIKADGWHTKY